LLRKLISLPVNTVFILFRLDWLSLEMARNLEMNALSLDYDVTDLRYIANIEIVALNYVIPIIERALSPIRSMKLIK